MNLDDLAEKDNTPKSLPNVVGVRLRSAGKMIYFSGRDLKLKPGQRVVVEAERGLALAKVVKVDIEYTPGKNSRPLKKVVRFIDERDLIIDEENKKRNREAILTCRRMVKDLSLAMNMIEVEYQHSANKAVFYFSAEGRVDFRELVRMLAQTLRIRVEMRQVGIRDEAKLVGGLGPCGLPTCCSTYLVNFNPVSIRMAKEQNLTLNPEKVSGLCGRLMCCLGYESEVYKELKAGLPKIGKRADTWMGKGRVLEINIFTSQIRMELENRERVSISIADLRSWRKDPEAFEAILKKRQAQERQKALKNIGISDKGSGTGSGDESRLLNGKKSGGRGGGKGKPGDRDGRPKGKGRPPRGKPGPRKDAAPGGGQGKTAAAGGDQKPGDNTESGEKKPRRRRRSRGGKRRRGPRGPRPEGAQGKQGERKPQNRNESSQKKTSGQGGNPSQPNKGRPQAGGGRRSEGSGKAGNSENRNSGSGSGRPRSDNRQRNSAGGGPKGGKSGDGPKN